ncbi:hypothetical protein NX722_11865 [Endozoicomonas gorgoniicola]|uniref:Uncharacterized protein n=1 Tax=Endozoicomonas gorgoniicola TaxID=1234144 RepID=A0ABT3MVC6_9GAMM|nr:hypothetical protein [Endozoicomonas gorgoniicola]MCW7553322.1 hypothetical protein [Endozoicomonas gorgoniicola]
MKFLSARQAIHDAYATNLTSKGFEINPVSFRSSGNTRKQSNDSRICHTVEAGIVIAAVEGLEEPFRSWAKWAYGPRTQEFLPEQNRFFRWLDEDVDRRLGESERQYRNSTRQKIKDVVAYSVMDYRSYIISERHLYPVSLIINRCKIIRQNWKRDFEPWHQLYWQLCDTYFDQNCLASVAEVIGRFRGGV